MRLILFFSLIFLLSVQAAQSENIADCPGAPPSRLVIGQRGLILPNYPADLHIEPLLSSETIETIPANSVFEALEGPVCAENFAWWRVRYADHQGWIIEGEFDRYFLEPLTPITAANIQQLQVSQLLGRGIFTTGVEWSSDGASIMVGSTVGVVWFDAADLSKPSSWYNPSPSGQVCDVEYSDDGSGRWGFATCAEGSTEIRTINENPYAERWYSFDGEIHEFKFINGSDSLVIATENKVMLLGGGVGSQDLLWEGENRIAALDVSPNGLAFAASDGKKVALGTPFSRGSTTLLDVGDVFAVTSLALNFDGTLLAIGVNRQIQLWDVETQTMLAVHDNLGGVDELSCYEGPIRNEVMRSIDFQEIPAVRSTHDMEFSVDGQRLVTATDNGTLTIWEVSSSDIHQTDLIDAGGCEPLTHLALNPDRTQAAFITVERREPRSNLLSIWGIDLQQPVALVSEGHSRTIRDIAFSPDSLTLASASGDASVRLWNFVAGIELPQTIQSIGNGRIVTFSPDGKWLAVLYGQGGGEASWWILELWDREHNRSQVRLRGSLFALAAGLAFSPDGHWLASDIRLPEEKSVKIWDLNRLLDAPASDSIQPDFSVPHEAWETTVAFSPDSRWLAFTDIDEKANAFVTLVDTITYTPVRKFEGHTNPIWDVTFSPDSKLLVSVSGTFSPDNIYQTPQTDFTARVWDIETGDEKFLLQHESSVSSVAFHPDGTFFATGSADGIVNFWDAATGEHLQMIQTRYGGVNALAFSPDGVWLAASTGSVVKIYRIPLSNMFGEG